MHDDPMVLPEGAGLPADIAAALRERGAVIDPAWTAALYAQRGRQPDPGEGVHCTRDIAYGPDPRHRLDVVAPGPASKTSAPWPVLVFLHGGGFVRGDKSQRGNIARAFAREGFLVLLPNYRLAPAHRWPAGALDVAAVMQWVATQAAAFGGDARRTILAGESAGAAHVAASMLVRRLGPPPPARPLGVVLVSGVYNLRLEALARTQFGIPTPDPRNEAYFGSDPAAWAQMSTVELVDVPPFPLLITFAQWDPLQMQVQAGELFARLVARHRFQPSLHLVRGHNHLSQLEAVGTGDTLLLRPLLAWMRRQLLSAGPAA